MNNFEKIKSMSVEQMAKFLMAIAKSCYGECSGCPLEKCDLCDEEEAVVYFLKQEVEENE